MAHPLTPDDPESLGGYRLAGRLGEGGQGVVYLAHPAGGGDPVAVKLLSAGDRETRARLARELDALEGIASFCTARVLDASVDGPRPYVVSEYVDGPSLAERVRERGPLRGGELERLVVGTATALAAIHAAGIVHRDFKPGNVLLGPDGPRVVDFGIARAEGAATLTSGIIGTPAYLAPEQINGTPASAASDVFAWAASMVYAGTGVSPFGADTVPAVLHRVLHSEPDLSPLPERLRGLLAACLSKEPGRRPTAQHLMVALVTPGPPPGGPAPVGTAPRRPAGTVPGRSRPRGLIMGAVAAAAVLAASAVTAAVLLNQPPGRLTDTGRSPSAAPPATTSPASGNGSTAPTSPPTSLPASPPASVASRPAGNPRIPAAFAGHWSGHTTSTNPMDGDGADNEVRLKSGESTAEWREDNNGGKCRGTITLTQVEDTRLTFSLGANEGGCIAGTIWLDLRPDGTLGYTWRDEPGLGLVTQTGSLSKN
ncbi:Serine/threonine-protein kinase AfsK [Nonomuraea coxensis DSM 45129]|uniref:Serine/threonine-protein kinase AfsK n=1 Tax=Nonomuraea coxensis DSM 45129 TaxID=1122611 RepID=A0ABX8U1Q5_9ACTN|nr:serine/threonine-protein kinase [Nonomuraea coxensis]QYC41064.1 Serine/threonine-protein kinase AfsK [Nonomuraea coxensis DSM 45129]